MLELGSVIVSSIIISLSFFYIIKTILKDKTKLLEVKTIILMISFIIIQTLIYSPTYSAIKVILTYLTLLITYKYIFKISITKSLLVVALAVMIYIIADGVASIVILIFATLEELRSNSIIIVASNALVGLLAYQIVSINIVRQIFNGFITRADNNKIYNNILFTILVILAWSTLAYNLIDSSALSFEYMINLAFMLICIFLTVIYMHEKHNNQKLYDKYDCLLNYVNDFEEVLEREQLANHEHKNQLAALRFIVKGNKKAEKYIDDMLGELTEIESKYSSDMKNIPRGTIKSLLYYKIVLAEVNKIDVYVNASKTIYKYLSSVSEADIKKLSLLIGIYMDNAIEGATNNNERKIMIEMYISNDKYKIVISNTYSGNIDKENIKVKGYSTKSNKRGKGLYFANKLISQDLKFSENTTITEKYYIQELYYAK